MTIKEGKVRVGISLFGGFLRGKFWSRLPFFFPIYAVYVNGKKYRADKECDPFVGEPLKQLVGKKVEVIISDGKLFALRGVEEAVRHVIIHCYIIALSDIFTSRVQENIQDTMTKTLIQEGIIEQAAEDYYQQEWLPGE